MASSMPGFSSARTWLLAVSCCAGLSCHTAEPTSTVPAAPSTDDGSAIHETTTVAPLDETFAELRAALVRDGFEILSETNVGRRLADHAQAWGARYNQPGLDGIRGMSVCHPGHANRSSNVDPTMLALCPLHVTLFSKDDETTIVFVRPTAVTDSAEANEVARALEEAIVGAIRSVATQQPVALKSAQCHYDFDCRGDYVCDRHECVRWWQLHGETPEVAPDELAAMVRDGEVELLDVRTPTEFRRGHIEGAHSVPLGQLEKQQHALPVSREDKVVAICLTAHRSVAAVRLLKRLGYQVLHLAGGMQAWRRANLPEVKGDADASARAP